MFRIPAPPRQFIERNLALNHRRAEERSAREVRSGKFTDPQNIELLVSPVSSGARVNTVTASTVPVFAACVGLYANMVAKLPIKLYEPTQNGAQERKDLPAIQCLSASDVSTKFELFREGQAGVGYGGNGYIRVYRDRNYNPTSVEVLPPINVQPIKVRDSVTGIPSVVYQVNGSREFLTRADIIHVRGATRPGEVIGISPVTQLRESIGISLSQRELAGSIAKNGARFPGIISTPASLDESQLKRARDEWNRVQSGVDNAGKTAFLHGQWAYAATNGMSMQDAEFLESRKFERTEICTLFMVPEVILGNSEKSSSWGTGIETLTNGFLAIGLDPVLIAWEEAMNYTLLTREQQAAGFFFKFNRRAALAMLPAAMAAFLRDMRDIRVYSANDCRRFLDENLLDDTQGGNDYAAPFNGSGGGAKVISQPAGQVSS